MTDVDPARLAMLDQLIADEEAGARLEPVVMGPFTGYMLVAALQLVLRHPSYSSGGRLADTIEGIARQLVELFPDDVAQLLEEGFDPELDVDPPRNTDSVNP